MVNHSVSFLLAFLFQYFWSQNVEAKVHQLDFALERIFLSLKEITVLYLMAFLYLNCYLRLRKYKKYILKVMLSCCSQIH